MLLNLRRTPPSSLVSRNWQTNSKRDATRCEVRALCRPRPRIPTRQQRSLRSRTPSHRRDQHCDEEPPATHLRCPHAFVSRRTTTFQQQHSVMHLHLPHRRHRRQPRALPRSEITAPTVSNIHQGGNRENRRRWRLPRRRRRQPLPSVHVQTQARESAPDYATTLQNSNARWKLPICDTRRNFRRAETARVSAPDYMTTLRN